MSVRQTLFYLEGMARSMRLGFLLDEETTQMAILIAQYQGVSPHTLMRQSIATMYRAYEKLSQTQEGDYE